MSRSVLSRLLVDLDANAAAGSPHDGPPRHSDRWRSAFTARFAASFLHRSASESRGIPVLPLLLKQLNQFLTGADISPDAEIGPGVVFYHPNGVVIGSGVQIGADAILQQGVTLGGLGGPRRAQAARTVVGSRAFFGAGSRVIGEIVIGNDVIVGANAVVTKDVPSDSIAVGVPARFRPRAQSNDDPDLVSDTAASAP